jgi:hypothetical protein
MVLSGAGPIACSCREGELTTAELAFGPQAYQQQGRRSGAEQDHAAGDRGAHAVEAETEAVRSTNQPPPVATIKRALTGEERAFMRPAPGSRS